MLAISVQMAAIRLRELANCALKPAGNKGTIRDRGEA
jgi:hypothetical protein